MYSQISTLFFKNSALLILAIFLLSQFMAWRLWRSHLKKGPLRLVLGIIYLFMNLGWAYTVAELFISQNPPPSHFLWTFVVRPAIIWQELHVIWLIPCLLLNILVFLWRIFFQRSNKGLPKLFKAEHRHQTLFILEFTILVVMLGLGCFGLYHQNEPVSVSKTIIYKANLDPALDGFTIAFISDLHFGLWTNQEDLDSTMASIADLNPQIVLFGGDLIDKNPYFAQNYEASLKLLGEIPFGLYGVLGNHDHYAGEPQKTAEIFTNLGLHILMDERINIDGLPLTIIGFDDGGTSRSLRPTENDLEYLFDFNALKGSDIVSTNFTILLNHRPESLNEAASYGIDLYLAGHSHGGQYQVPWNSQLNMAAFFLKYTSGLYREGSTPLLVSRGVASVGMPFRLWAWPEINLIILKRP